MNILDKSVEFMKYDHNDKKYGLVLLIQLMIKVLAILGCHNKAFRITSILFRTGWAGSESVGLAIAKDYFIMRPEIGQTIAQKFINEQAPLPHTEKFFTDPAEMLDGIITVLKAPITGEKGALLIKYSYYFPLFIKYFDVEAVAERYNIILEPSWAGFCEENILIYTQYDFPIYIQVYEVRDKTFIDQLQSNLTPMNVGPSWFIDHTRFITNAPNAVRDIDIIIVAAWAKYKRHEAFFQALSKQNATTPLRKLNIVCVGYPGDLTKDDIMGFAHEANLRDQVTIYEWITPEAVSALQQRAKVNLLWSKFEGNNRAIIEGMFCNTPVILREGHNYGEQYDFINSQTGHFANETTLYPTLIAMLDNPGDYHPRKYVLEHRNCIRATEIMSLCIKERELQQQRPWTTGLTVKVNNLHGMSYMEPASKEIMDCYDELARYIKS